MWAGRSANKATVLRGVLVLINFAVIWLSCMPAGNLKAKTFCFGCKDIFSSQSENLKFGKGHWGHWNVFKDRALQNAGFICFLVNIVVVGFFFSTTNPYQRLKPILVGRGTRDPEAQLGLNLGFQKVKSKQHGFCPLLFLQLQCMVHVPSKFRFFVLN